MIGVDEALSEVLRSVAPLPPERVPLLDALGRVLAEDIAAGADLPAFDGSAMDGYAVRAADTSRASPSGATTLRVVASVAAGSVCPARVGRGEAVRIMTGAPLPEGADSVVPLEDTGDADRPKEERLSRPADTVTVRAPVLQGANVRRRGEDVRSGALVLARGRMLRPQELAILAALGQANAAVHRRPRVAVLSTGDELAGPGEPLGPGRVCDANGVSCAAMVSRAGGVPLPLGVARDDLGELASRLREGLALGPDLFVTSGGVSVGDRDVVKDVLGAEGSVRFWQVRMRPGKPLAFGVLAGGVPILGLPGNPVAAMVSFEAFARPAILRMLGHERLARPAVRAALDGPVPPAGDRRTYLRVVAERRADGWHARSAGGQGSAMLSSLARANGLAVIPEGTGGLGAGSEVEVWMLDWPEWAMIP